MRLQNIHRRLALVLSFSNGKVYTFLVLVNVKGLISDFLKIKDYFFFVLNNFNSFLRIYLKKKIIF